jgi:hypothetical protein
VISAIVGAGVGVTRKLAALTRGKRGNAMTAIACGVARQLKRNRPITSVKKTSCSNPNIAPNRAPWIVPA